MSASPELPTPGVALGSEGPLGELSLTAGPVGVHGCARGGQLAGTKGVGRTILTEWEAALLVTGSPPHLVSSRPLKGEILGTPLGLTGAVRFR